MKKAQADPLWIIVSVGLFILVWAFMAPSLNTIVGNGIVTGNLTGLEAFVLGNLNLWLVIILLLFILGAWRFYRE